MHIVTHVEGKNGSKHKTIENSRKILYHFTDEKRKKDYDGLKTVELVEADELVNKA